MLKILIIYLKDALMLSVPDISVWNFQKVKTMDDLFTGCSKVVNYEDLKNWNKKIINSKKIDKKKA